jgi:hypothetical protein
VIVYFAILRKLHNGQHGGAVVTRSRPGTAHGWGVSCSDELLDELYANDRVTRRRLRALVPAPANATGRASPSRATRSDRSRARHAPGPIECRSRSHPEAAVPAMAIDPDVALVDIAGISTRKPSARPTILTHVARWRAATSSSTCPR